MTCIVAVKKNGNVWIGGDSAASGSYMIRTRKEPKVFKKGNMIFGFTSSFRMGQIIRYSFTAPEHNHSICDLEYLSSVFVDALMSCYNEKKYGEEKDGEKRGGTFIIGYNGKIYTVENDFQVAEDIDDYTAVGSGREYALGALRYGGGIRAPESEIKSALSAAQYFDKNVREPFNIISLDNSKIVVNQ